MSPQRWDVFCQVIDNHGDLGVCWRLAADLATRGHAVRLWVDDARALAWMAPAGQPGVQVLAWPDPVPASGPGDVVIEAFGCEIPAPFQAAMATKVPRPPLWINLEYLSAEAYVERCHRLPSPIGTGPAAGLTRWFFYPGFTGRTGGLLRELDLRERQAAFDRDGWRAAQGIPPEACAVSLFCYEPPRLPELLQQFATGPHTTSLLATPGRATAAVQAALALLETNDVQRQIGLQANGIERNALSISYLSHVPQPVFDEMLWACDLNLVRGEDSLVRALWAGQPLVWQIYPQDDNAHHAKLDAFLDWLQAPPSLRKFHQIWNGIDHDSALPLLDAALLEEWKTCVQAARTRLLAQDDLLTQLLGFVTEKS